MKEIEVEATHGQIKDSENIASGTANRQSTLMVCPRMRSAICQDIVHIKATTSMTYFC